MVEKCSYCGEEGHSIQNCPKWKGTVATATMPRGNILRISSKALNKAEEEGIEIMGVGFRPLGERTIYFEMPPDELKELATKLEAHKIPFAISAPPLYVFRKHSSPVTVEEMRRALYTMEHRIGYMLPESRETKMFEATMFAAKTAMKDAHERRVFIQDFAASLNRKGLLINENIDDFMKYGYIYMEAQ